MIKTFNELYLMSINEELIDLRDKISNLDKNNENDYLKFRKLQNRYFYLKEKKSNLIKNKGVKL